MQLFMGAPSSEQRAEVLQALVAPGVGSHGEAVASDVIVDVARRAAGSSIASLRALVAAAGVEAGRESADSAGPAATGAGPGAGAGAGDAPSTLPPRLGASDFEAGLAALRQAAVSSVDAPSIPNVRWDDIGGLAHAKKEILDMVQLPLEHPELFADGLRQRSGILLFGAYPARRHGGLRQRRHNTPTCSCASSFQARRGRGRHCWQRPWLQSAR